MTSIVKRASTDVVASAPVAKKQNCDATDEQRRGGGGGDRSTEAVPIFAVVAHRKGEREFMEDETTVEHELLDTIGDNAPEKLNRLSFFAIYDGHNGGRASQFCAEHVHKHVVRQIVATLQSRDHTNSEDKMASLDKSMKRILIDAYKSTDEEYLEKASKGKPSWKDGCTATTALLLNNTLYVANVGDSRAIVCRYKPATTSNVCLTLTVDHSPAQFEERQRIQKAGGVVKDGRILGQLEVSRSIGDGQYKNHGVICTPNMKKCTITENDRYVVMACDGLWNAFKENRYVIDFIDDHIARAVTAIPSPKMSGNLWTQRWTWVADKLCEEGVRRASGDNVSVVIMPLHRWFM